MSEDTMVSSPSSTTPTSTTVDLPSPSTGKEPSTTTSPSSSTSIKDTVIALDKMLRCVSREVYALGYQLNKSFQSDELSGVIDIVAERTNMFMYDSKLLFFQVMYILYLGTTISDHWISAGSYVVRRTTELSSGKFSLGFLLQNIFKKNEQFRVDLSHNEVKCGNMKFDWLYTFNEPIKLPSTFNMIMRRVYCTRVSKVKYVYENNVSLVSMSSCSNTRSIRDTVISLELMLLPCINQISCSFTTLYIIF